MATSDCKPLGPLTEADIARFWRFVDKTPGQGPKGECWGWTGGHNKRGYGNMYLHGGRNARSTRVGYAIQNGTDPYPDLVLHRCDWPPCSRGSHLFTGTQLDNRQDAKQKGRTATGDRNGSRTKPECLKRGDDHPIRLHIEYRRPKYTPDRVIAIREYAKSHPSESMRSIGRHFGMPYMTVRQIVSRETWQHLP